MVLHHQFHGLPPLVFMLPVSFAILAIYTTSFIFASLGVYASFICYPWCLTVHFIFAALDAGCAAIFIFASLGICTCHCQVLVLLISFFAALIVQWGASLLASLDVSASFICSLGVCTAYYIFPTLDVFCHFHFLSPLVIGLVSLFVSLCACTASSTFCHPWCLHCQLPLVLHASANLFVATIGVALPLLCWPMWYMVSNGFICYHCQCCTTSFTCCHLDVA